MWELWGVLIGAESLIGLKGIFVVVRVPLELEEKVVGDTVGSIPRVPDVDPLVCSVLKSLPPESVVLNVVDDLKHDHAAKTCQEHEASGKGTPVLVDHSEEDCASKKAANHK